MGTEQIDACGFVGKAADEMLGQRGNCPKCKAEVTIDALEWAVADMLTQVCATRD